MSTLSACLPARVKVEGTESRASSVMGLRIMQAAFLPPWPSASDLRSKSLSEARHRPRGSTRSRSVYAAAKTVNSRATVPEASKNSSALDREIAEDHFVDLRTLKKVGWNCVRTAEASAPGCCFGPFDSASAVAALADDVLFGPDTIPLSPPQRTVVRALLARRSVLFSALIPGKETLVLDLTLRAREWNETIIYCASSERAAKSMYLAIVNHLQSKKSVFLDVGSEQYPSAESNSKRQGLIITIPRVLRRALIDTEAHYWGTSSDLVILDDLLTAGIPEWEEIILNMPSRVLLCILATDLSEYERDEFPLWLETVQNRITPVALRGGLRVLDRIGRSTELSNFRVFVYNAAVHSYPVQISLPLVVKEIEKELELSKASLFRSSAPANDSDRRRRRLVGDRRLGSASTLGSALIAESIDYESALLQGVEVIPAENISSLAFDCRDHAEYADVASLIVSDIRRNPVNRAKEQNEPQKSATVARKKSSATSASAVSRRRRRPECMLLPALVLIHGRRETEAAAGAILASSDELQLELAYDCDSAEHLTQLVSEYREEHSANMSGVDNIFLSHIEHGVGIIHDGILPVLQLLAQELFSDGLIPVLVVDTHIGSRQIASLPIARSVLVQSSAVDEYSDVHKGVIKGTTISKLAGRPEVDDVGNVIVLWFDEGVSNSEAASNASFSFLGEELRARASPLQKVTKFEKASNSSVFELLDPKHPATILPGYLPFVPAQRRSGSFCLTYAGVLGSLRCQDDNDFRAICELTLDSFRSWMAAAAVRATREKLEIECKAIEDHLIGVDWDELASHDRLEAKLSENLRLHETMLARKQSVISQLLLEELKIAVPGTIIGLRLKTDGLLGNPSPKGLFSSHDKTEELEEGISEGKRPSTSHVEASPSVGRKSDGNRSHDDVKSSSESIVGTSAMPGTASSVVPAVFVDVLDNHSGSARSSVLKSEIVVACILADGMWTLVPSDDVVAVGCPKTVIPNADILSAPHLATFDLDPVVQWGKCKPFLDSEIARVSMVSDRLLDVMASGDAPGVSFRPLSLPELDKQASCVESARRLYEGSPWYGREAEMADLRRLRRRLAKLGDEIDVIRNSEREIESKQQQSRYGFQSRLRALMAVMEDCNAINIPSDSTLDMTPIGVLASILPGPYPMFTAACLLLVSGLDELSPAALAAFVTVAISSPDDILKNRGSRSNLADDLEGKNGYSGKDLLSPLTGTPASFNQSNANSRSLTGVVRDADDLEGILPGSVIREMEDITKALRIVQTRHYNNNSLSQACPRISPARLDTSKARTIFNFVDGAQSWEDIVTNTSEEPGQIVENFRNCLDALDVVSRDNAALGELSDLQPVALEALHRLRVWPIVDLTDATVLQKFSVGMRRFGCTGKTMSYKSWWTRAKDAVKQALKDAEESVENVAAEVVPANDIQ